MDMQSKQRGFEGKPFLPVRTPVKECFQSS